MKKLGLFLSIILLTLFLACNQSDKTNTAEKPAKTTNENAAAMAKAPPPPIDLKIEKIDGVWKVINTARPGEVPHVRRNGIIRWDTGETDAYFQFPDTIFSPVGPPDSLKHGYLKHQKKGTILKLLVKKTADTTTYTYAVFCMADSTFAQEDSPPRIIVED